MLIKITYNTGHMQVSDIYDDDHEQKLDQTISSGIRKINIIIVNSYSGVSQQPGLN